MTDLDARMIAHTWDADKPALNIFAHQGAIDVDNMMSEIEEILWTNPHPDDEEDLFFLISYINDHGDRGPTPIGG